MTSAAARHRRRGGGARGRGGMGAGAGVATAGPSAPSADGQVVGALLVLLGGVWLLDRAGVLSMSAETMLATLLVVLGVGLVATARRAGGSGLLLLGGVLSLVLAATSSIDLGILKSGVGSRVIDGSTVDSVRSVSSLGVGELAIDLSELEVPPGARTSLRYRLGVGDMRLRLPADEATGVRVTAGAQMGHLIVIGQEENGSDAALTYESPGYESATRKLVVDLDVGIGKVTVERAPS